MAYTYTHVMYESDVISMYSKNLLIGTVGGCAACLIVMIMMTSDTIFNTE